jgi:hypothetical protein
MKPRFADPQLTAALVRIGDRDTRRRCAKELVEFSALRAKVEPGFFDAIRTRLLANFNLDQAALSRAMARVNIVARQILDDDFTTTTPLFSDDDPVCVEFVAQCEKLSPLITEAMRLYLQADGLAGALPERGYQLVLRIDATTRAYKRARVAFLTEIRSRERMCT